MSIMDKKSNEKKYFKLFSWKLKEYLEISKLF